MFGPDADTSRNFNSFSMLNVVKNNLYSTPIMSRPITVTDIDYGPTEAAHEHRFPPTLYSHIDKEINDNILNGDIMEKKNATVLFQSKKL